MTTSPHPRPARSVALLADPDSRWKWAVQLANRLRPTSALSGYQLAPVPSPGHRQLAAAGIEPDRVRAVAPAELVTALAATQPDVLVIVSSTAAVEAIHRGVPSARRNGLGAAVDQLPARVTELLAGAMLPGPLATYGVAVDGMPLADRDTMNKGLRTAVRSSARSMYRHGRTVVAPALRTLSAL